MFIFMYSQMSLKLGHVGQKLGHQVRSKENLVNILDVTSWWSFIMNLELSNVGSKTRSVGQFKGRHSRGQTFIPMSLKLIDTVCYRDVLVKFDMVMVLWGQKLCQRTSLFKFYRGHNLSQYFFETQLNLPPKTVCHVDSSEKNLVLPEFGSRRVLIFQQCWTNTVTRLFYFWQNHRTLFLSGR